MKTNPCTKYPSVSPSSPATRNTYISFQWHLPVQQNFETTLIPSNSVSPEKSPPWKHFLWIQHTSSYLQHSTPSISHCFVAWICAGSGTACSVSTAMWGDGMLTPANQDAQGELYGSAGHLLQISMGKRRANALFTSPRHCAPDLQKLWTVTAELQESGAVNLHGHFLGRGSQSTGSGEQPAPCQLILAVLFPKDEVSNRCDSMFKKFIPFFPPHLKKVTLSLTDFVPLFNTSTDKQHYLHIFS